MLSGIISWNTNGFISQGFGYCIIISSPDHRSFSCRGTGYACRQSVSDEDIFYPNSGILVRFLVRRYGVDVVNDMFPLRPDRLKNRFEELTGNTWEEMASLYAEYIHDL